MAIPPPRSTGRRDGKKNRVEKITIPGWEERTDRFYINY
jgi:hypothetical protein